MIVDRKYYNLQRGARAKGPYTEVRAREPINQGCRGRHRGVDVVL